MIFQEKPITILSVDAGGIRGLVPLYIIREIEQRLTRHGAHRHFVDFFDLLAGTSTDGLIVLALAAPKSVSGLTKKLFPQPEFDVTYFRFNDTISPD